MSNGHRVTASTTGTGARDSTSLHGWTNDEQPAATRDISTGLYERMSNSGSIPQVVTSDKREQVDKTRSSLVYKQGKSTR